MPKKSNKHIILETALDLFNANGVKNVRLQHISDASIISLGNITYHFRTKDDIILNLWNSIQQEQKVLMAEFIIMPLFADIDRYTSSLFELQLKYKFFYQDTLEIIRAYPSIAEIYRKHIHWQEQQILSAFKFNIARGVFNNEISTDEYERLARLWVGLSEGWINRNMIVDDNQLSYPMFRNDLWLLLKGHMTSFGLEELNTLLE